MKKKIILLICDGLGDRAVKELGFKTPLQAAHRTNLDKLASNGMCGLMDTIGPGIRPGSDVAQLVLFGYDCFSIYTGRGPFEAAGLGIEMKEGDVAFRCNFGTVDEDMRVLDRRAGRINSGTDKLAAELDGMTIEDVKVIFKESVEHRAVLVLHGPGLLGNVSDPDPHGDDRVEEARALAEGAEKTARILNIFVRRSHERLKSHEVNVERKAKGLPEANIILPRGGGSYPEIESFGEVHGMRAACVAGVTLIKGICRTVGMEVLDVEGATGTLDTDMNAKADATIGALAKHDFVYVNVKAPDICSHDGLARKKVEIIEKIDKMVGRLVERLPDGILLAITADHSTPVSVRDHSGDPVPILIFGEDVRRDGVQHFDEISCAKGAIGRIQGKDLMPILKNLSNRCEKYGS
jgi:2,3-bisphosphoglycerate-independent phosphoglycerate mutase